MNSMEKVYVAVVERTTKSIGKRRYFVTAKNIKEALEKVERVAPAQVIQIILADSTAIIWEEVLPPSK